MMQLIALVAMEPPVQFEADYIRDEKVKVFKTIKEMDFDYIKNNIIKGQYGPGKIKGKNVAGYQEERNVYHDSSTPTFIAGKIYIENWRWSGVPFYIRSGKRLAKKLTEIYIHFKTPPLKLFGDECRDIEPNGLVLSIQPEEKISMTLNLKYPGTKNTPYPVDMQFDYKSVAGRVKLDAYERLIIDCLKGDLTLFARQDGIEAMWKVVDPINKYWEEVDKTKLPNYFSGTWGPQKSFDLIEKEGRKWRLTDDY
jgi:glucose-6-phosphate 1-dehydrogenase